jgi:hypothetical protein
VALTNRAEQIIDFVEEASCGKRQPATACVDRGGADNEQLSGKREIEGDDERS